MLIQDFHRNFKIELDKVDSLGYPELLPEEIDAFLNKAILKFISQRLYGNNFKGESFEETQKRFDDLFTLVTSVNIVPTSGTITTKPTAVIATLPVDYWHCVQEEVEINYLDCDNRTVVKRVPVYPITHDRYNKIIRDPFNKPSIDGVIRLGTDNSIELIAHLNSTITTYFLRYIRKPASVRYGTTYVIPTTDVQCDLPESVHSELVSIAVADCLEKIESPRTVIANQLIKEIE